MLFPKAKLLKISLKWLSNWVFMNILDSFQLNGQRALITGSSSGIGFALARGV